MPFATLLAALAEVPDPRRAQGQRYSMRHLLLFSVLATLAGATSYQKLIAFIALQRERLNAVFGACFRRAPAVNTLRHLFLALGRDDLEAAFRRHVCNLNAHSRPEALRTVALDDKTLRGSFDHLTDRKAVYVLSAFASDAAMIRRGLEKMTLGPAAYPMVKAKRDSSMPSKRERSEDAYGRVPQGPRDMVRTELFEPQPPAMQAYIPRHSVLC